MLINNNFKGIIDHHDFCHICAALIWEDLEYNKGSQIWRDELYNSADTTAAFTPTYNVYMCVLKSAHLHMKTRDSKMIPRKCQVYYPLLCTVNSSYCELHSTWHRLFHIHECVPLTGQLIVINTSMQSTPWQYNLSSRYRSPTKCFQITFAHFAPNLYNFLLSEEHKIR